MQYRVVLPLSTFISLGSNPRSQWHSSAQILSFPKCPSIPVPLLRPPLIPVSLSRDRRHFIPAPAPSLPPLPCRRRRPLPLSPHCRPHPLAPCTNPFFLSFPACASDLKVKVTFLCGGAGPAWARSGGAGPACGGARSSCGSPGFPSLYFRCGGARSSCGDLYPQH
jgi:hypothetical protein